MAYAGKVESGGGVSVEKLIKHRAPQGRRGHRGNQGSGFRIAMEPGLGASTHLAKALLAALGRGGPGLTVRIGPPCLLEYG